MAEKAFEINDILKSLPHRYPFLLIDRIIDFVPDETLTAIKNVTYNEPFFPGHFAGRPIMPGVMILEAMAQASAMLIIRTDGEALPQDQLYYFTAIDKARFKRPVQPGDQLEIRAKLLRRINTIAKFDVTAYVDGNKVCNAEMMAARVDHE